MQSVESTRFTRITGLVVAVFLLFAFMLQAAPGALGQGFKDKGDDDANNPYEDAGIVDDRAYESPIWGWDLEWERGWDLDTYFDPPVTTDEANRYDALHLVWNGDGGDYAYVAIEGARATVNDPADQIDVWTNPDFIDDAWGPTYDVTAILTYDDEDSAQVVYAIVDPVNGNAMYVTIFEVVVVNGDWVFFTVNVDEASLEAAFDAVTTDLALNGDPILTGISWEEIEEAIEDAG
jgi:hypothetical protein